MTSASHKLTPALIRAMIAVRAGRVTQVYTKTGNVFRGPSYTGAVCYRRLEAMKFIEDMPGQNDRHRLHFRKQLSVIGEQALEAAETPPCKP